MSDGKEVRRGRLHRVAHAAAWTLGSLFALVITLYVGAICGRDCSICR